MKRVLIFFAFLVAFTISNSAFSKAILTLRGIVPSYARITESRISTAGLELGIWAEPGYQIQFAYDDKDLKFYAYVPESSASAPLNIPLKDAAGAAPSKFVKLSILAP